MSPVIRVEVVVVGGGHNGLAMSKRLSDRGIDHVVLERGEVANSWRTERWDSFTLLTPNWQARLPGQVYDGDDPDGFMTAAETVDFVTRYAASIDAPVRSGTTVVALRGADDGYEVVTDQGVWRGRCVVLASGACNIAVATELRRGRAGQRRAGQPAGVPQSRAASRRRRARRGRGGHWRAARRRDPRVRPTGDPLGGRARPRCRAPTEVATSSTGWRRSGGSTSATTRSRRSSGLARWPRRSSIGTPEHRTLDLNRLSDAGVELRGRLGSVRDGVALFSGGLRNHCALADQKLDRLLDDIDAWIEDHGPDDVGAVERYEPTRVARGIPLTLDLTVGQIRTIVWATGFKPDLSWVDLPVFDADGRLRHDGGVVVDAPGVYFLGASFLRRRKSSFIHGADDDTRDLADHLVRHLGVSG